PPACAGSRADRDHPLPAAAGLHRTGLRARAGQRHHRALGRTGAGRRTGRARLRLAGRCARRPSSGGELMSAIATWQDQYRARAATLPGAALPWLAALRGRAMERFVAQGWPTRRLENWHHTSLAFLEGLEFRVPVAGTAAPTPLMA